MSWRLVIVANFALWMITTCVAAIVLLSEYWLGEYTPDILSSLGWGLFAFPLIELISTYLLAPLVSRVRRFIVAFFLESLGWLFLI